MRQRCPEKEPADAPEAVDLRHTELPGELLYTRAPKRTTNKCYQSTKPRGKSAYPYFYHVQGQQSQ